MFTGLIEETGIVTDIKDNATSLIFTISANKVLENLKIGDSIAIDGVCETVVSINNNSFSVFVSYETLKITNFTNYTKGTKVNLERTLRVGDRLDGHIVSGHVDGKAQISAINSIGETTVISFTTTPELAKQIVKKGSVCIDGISLTVANIENNTFSVAIIPHTLINTTLEHKKINDYVNLETDIISKYVEKYLLSNDNIKCTIDMDLLERNGFL